MQLVGGLVGVVVLLDLPVLGGGLLPGEAPREVIPSQRRQLPARNEGFPPVTADELGSGREGYRDPPSTHAKHV